jgi:acyl carrier protein
MGIRSKLVDLVATTLDLPSDRVDDNLSSDTNEAWDSVRHLMLILAVEETFGIEFGEAELLSLTNFRALLTSIETRIGR